MAGFFRRTAAKTGKKMGDWMGLSVTLGVFTLVKNIFISVFMPWKMGPPGPAETFEQAVARMGLSETDIEARKTLFMRQTLLYFGLGLAVVGYGLMLAFDKSVIGMFMCFGVSLVAFANAFRAHFWFFQTKHRKLGCTFKEWLNGSLGG